MKIALLFPGYGSQTIGMAKELYDNYRIVQDYFEEASYCLNSNAVKLCFSSSETELSQMHTAQAVLFLIGSAIYKLLEQQGIQPALVVGHNTGLYAALFAAQALSFPDGLYLLSKYATLVQEAVPSLDLVLRQVDDFAHERLFEVCAHVSTIDYQVTPSICFSDRSHIVVGQPAACNALERQIGHQAVISDQPSAYGIHSAAADGLADQFTPYLEKATLHAPKLMLVSEIDGRLITTADDVRNEIIALVNKPLSFVRILDVLALHDMLVQVGPPTVLATVFKKMYPLKQVISINKQANLDELLKVLAQDTIGQ